MKSLRPFLLTGPLLLAIAHGARAQDPTVLPCTGDPFTNTYCYTDNDHHAWRWQSECSGPITLQFTSGSIDMYDVLKLFDGADTISPPLFTTGSQEMDLAGMTFVSSAPDLYMKMTSNDTISCAEVRGLRASREWTWTVTSATGTAGIAEERGGGNFTMYPNPVTSGSHVRLAGLASTTLDIRILDVTGRSVHENRLAGTAGAFIDLDLSGLQSGQYSVVISTPTWVSARNLRIIR